MHHTFLLSFLAVAAMLISPVATAESCYFDEATGNFIAEPGGSDGQTGLEGSVAASAHLTGATAIEVNGLRYEKFGEGPDRLQGVNGFLAYAGMIEDVRLFLPANDQYSEFLFLAGDPRTCHWTSFRYTPETHFAWIEQDSFGVGFVFKHSGLAVDPASFQQHGEYKRGIGFDILSHPHKQEDGSQPRYNRTYIEADCAGKRLRVLDQRSYGAGRELLDVLLGSEKWFTYEDVYPALSMLAASMCEVPADLWDDKTRLPTTLDEFSDYVHAAAHGNVK